MKFYVTLFNGDKKAYKGFDTIEEAQKFKNLLKIYNNIIDNNYNHYYNIKIRLIPYNSSQGFFEYEFNENLIEYIQDMIKFSFNDKCKLHI
jgi:hypothetical protein